VPKSRELLDAVIEEAISTWSATNVEAVTNWKEFGRLCPGEGETAIEWVKVVLTSLFLLTFLRITLL
jgi:hypothetical protein